MNTIIRSIRFYKFFAGVDDNGNPISFDIQPILKEIAEKDNAEKYIKVDDGKITCIIDDEKLPFKLRLGNIRTSDLPMVEDHGNLTPLEIPKNAGLFDATHMVMFENGVIGIDSNYYGPRITKFLEYIHEIAKTHTPEILFIEPLINPKIIEQLHNMKNLKVFDLKIHRSYLAQISKIDDHLAEALSSALALGNPEIIELRLQIDTRSKTNLNNSLFGIIKKLLQRPEHEQELSKLVIKGFDEVLMQNVELDLLNDKIMAKREIVKIDTISRELDPNSAYHAIVNVYNEKKEIIKLSSSLHV